MFFVILVLSGWKTCYQNWTCLVCVFIFGLFLNQRAIGTSTLESCICGALQIEDSEIKMGIIGVTMANIKEGANALDMMEQHKVGTKEENQVSRVNMDESYIDEQQ